MYIIFTQTHTTMYIDAGVSSHSLFVWCDHSWSADSLSRSSASSIGLEAEWKLPGPGGWPSSSDEDTSVVWLSEHACSSVATCPVCPLPWELRRLESREMQCQHCYHITININTICNATYFPIPMNDEYQWKTNNFPHHPHFFAKIE